MNICVIYMLTSYIPESKFWVFQSPLTRGHTHTRHTDTFDCLSISKIKTESEASANEIRELCFAVCVCFFPIFSLLCTLCKYMNQKLKSIARECSFSKLVFHILKFVGWMYICQQKRNCPNHRRYLLIRIMMKITLPTNLKEWRRAAKGYWTKGERKKEREKEKKEKKNLWNSNFRTRQLQIPDV